MCNSACLEFARSHLTKADVDGKTVLEVGARDVNGSVRSIAEQLGPASYLGVDLVDGPGVDEICDTNDLVERFCTEVLEHLRDWRRGVSNIKNVLRSGGVLLLTTRSIGFGYHGFPYDFWRYELADMRTLFSDFTIDDLRTDPSAPGVFLRARRPHGFAENNLEEHRLYSICRRERRLHFRDTDMISIPVLKWRVRQLVASLRPGT